MIFGIDLGTTYSLIGRGDKLYSDLVPSAVNTVEQRCIYKGEVGKDIVGSYKTDMTIGESGNVPRKCSSIVLRELADLATKRSGYECKEVAISVPAKFSNTQRNAVWQAAIDAGLTPRAVINEPTAAAIYACENYKDLIIVYDLGGGTFDVTIIDARTGNYFIIASDGNSRLAGDNLDRAIANVALDFCKIPIRFRRYENMQKLYNACRDAKERISMSGVDQYINVPDMGLDYRLTLDKYLELMKTTFMPTIELTKELIDTYVMDIDNPKLLFVGGSTADPYLREWVKENLGLEEFKPDVNPSYLVAHGISKYAEMLEDGRAEAEIIDVTSRISIELDTGLTETLIEENSNIPIAESRVFSNSQDGSTLDINVYQGNELLASENEFIGKLLFDFGREVKAGEGMVEVTITVDRNGILHVTGMDLFTCDTKTIELIIR